MCGYDVGSCLCEMMLWRFLITGPDDMPYAWGNLMLSMRTRVMVMEGACCVCRVGQNHIYTAYIRYFWQGNHQTYGHIRCI